MPKIDLLPCPFCGSDRVMVTNPTMWQAWCKNCKAIGATNLTKQEAIEAWNTRASGWIPCSERMPDDNVDVLVYDDCILIARYNTYDKYDIGWMETFECYPLTNVTHWMPLPEIPKRKDDTHDND